MPTPIKIIGEFIRRKVMEREQDYGLKRHSGNGMIKSFTKEPKHPEQPYMDILVRAKELSEKVFDLFINESVYFHNAYESMGEKEEKRLRHLLAELLENDILDA